VKSAAQEGTATDGRIPYQKQAHGRTMGDKCDRAAEWTDCCITRLSATRPVRAASAHASVNPSASPTHAHPRGEGRTGRGTGGLL
jgi:hypothetical protein